MNSENDPGASAAADMSRRRLLERFTVALLAVGAAAVGLPLIGSIIVPVLKKMPRVWRPVGAVDHFVVGKTVLVSFRDPSALSWTGVTAETAAWLRRTAENEFIAFSINCTHLGCPVRWEAEAELFMCPCHGGVYYSDGAVAAGPPPLPLRRCPVRVTRGRVEIQTGPIPIT